MIKKIFFISFIIIFISGCGYTPIYSKKDQNFKITHIGGILEFDNDINNCIKNK